jgi:hypothetical protein
MDYLQYRVKTGLMDPNYGFRTETGRGTAAAGRLVNKYVKLVRGAKNVSEKRKYYANFQANLNKIYNNEAKELANLARQVAVSKGRSPPRPSPSPRRSPARPPMAPRMTPNAAQLRNKLIANLRSQLRSDVATRNAWQKIVNSRQRQINAILAKHRQS